MKKAAAEDGIRSVDFEKEYFYRLQFLRRPNALTRIQHALALRTPSAGLKMIGTAVCKRENLTPPLSLPVKFCCDLASGVEGRGDLRRVFAAALCHLWTASPAAAGYCGDLFYPIAGLEALGDQIIADGRDECHLLIVGSGQKDGVGR